MRGFPLVAASLVLAWIASVADAQEAPSPPASPQGAALPREYYLKVPIEGVLGTDAMAAGVESAITWAKRKRIGTIVFEVNSPGGAVREAETIVRLMQEHDELEFIVVVDRALSACVWLVAAADQVIMAPTGIIGAAVVYTEDDGGTATALDAKALSAVGAEVAAIAESKGRSGILFRAMIEPAVEVWIGEHADNAQPLEIASTPATAEQARVSWTMRDSPEAVLTLTAVEAVRTGVALSVSEDERLAGMRSAGGYGASAMQAAKREETKRTAKTQEDSRNVQRVREWAVEIEKLAAQAREKDPRLYDDYAWEVVNEYNAVVRTVRYTWTQWTSLSTRERAYMRMTAGSRAKWDQRTSEATRAWQGIVAGINDIAKLTGKLPDRGIVESEQTRMEIIHTEAVDSIRRLRQGY